MIQRAKQVLKELEKGEQETRRASFLDDLPLFSAAAPAIAPEPAPSDALRDALKDIDPDSLSPREALEALYRLKGLGKETP